MTTETAGTHQIPSLAELSRYLGKRWFRLPERVEQHQTINRYRNEGKRFKTVHAGRRSFKTEIAKRTLLAECLRNEGEALFFGAPTREQAKKIAWDDLKLLSPKWSIADKSETELWIKYRNGSSLWVLGFDKPERFEGKRWNGGVLDEYGNMAETVWTENVSPALLDTHGWCWLIGVPEGKNHYFELSQYARNSGDPEWGDYCWLTSDVLDPFEVEKERKRLDERTFRQEYEGSFESYEGRAYAYYSHDIHCVSRPVIAGLPLIVCCDFNVGVDSPCVWIIGQDKYPLQSNGRTTSGTHFKHEIVQRQTDIWKMCAELKRVLIELCNGETNARHQPLIFYGDYQHGKSRSLSATADSWNIIEGEFSGWNSQRRIKSNPRVLDRVNATNSRHRSADGMVHFSVDPSCVELMKDYDMVSMEDLKDANQGGKRGHACSAVDYMMNYEYPITGRLSHHV